MTHSSVLLIDDHAILLDGMRMLLEGRLDRVRVATASCLHDAMQHEAAPDAIVLDLKLPGINGLEGLAPLRRKWPQAQIVILSSQDDAETHKQALARGAVGFISKTEAGERIVEVVGALLQGRLPPAPPEPVLVPPQQYLTPRQCEVLDLLCQGLTNKVIARKLNLSDNTVRRHVQDIFAFLNVASRTEAVFEARRQGLVS